MAKKTAGTKLTLTVTVPVAIEGEIAAKAVKQLVKELKTGFEGNLPDDFNAALEGCDGIEPNEEGVFPAVKIGKVAVTLQ